MFVSVKKRTLLGCGLLLLALGILCLCGTFQERERSRATVGTPIANRVIVIDPGHGGFDAGASANGIEEKEVNLAVAQYLKEYIELGGGVAALTRDADISTAEEGTSGLTAKKSDLTERKNLSQSAGADVFVSVHMNKFPQTQYKGAQVFYSKTPEESKYLGEAIQDSLKEVLDDGNERMAKKTDGGIFILKDTKVPSVIVECGFLSNSEEAELLMQEGYRQKLAWGIYVGLVRYFNR